MLLCNHIEYRRLKLITRQPSWDFFVNPQFTYKQFCSIVEQNENTTRTWIKDHLTNVGNKKDSGRMLYSGYDAIVTKIFSHLVMNLSTPPGSAKVIALYASNRIRELMRLDEAKTKKLHKNPRVMVVRSINDDSGEGYRAVSVLSAGKILEKCKTPLIVLPIDRIYLITRTQVIEMAIQEKLLPEGASIV